MLKNFNASGFISSEDLFNIIVLTLNK